MQAHEFDKDGLRVVELEGEIDLSRSPELRRVLDVHARAQCPALALGFQGVDFIDSSGLATIIEYCRKAHEFGGRFAIYGLSERVRTVFEIVRLNEILGLHDTFDQARAALIAAGPLPS
ncbi:STAS domain-containing protein [Verrucomicrobiota bacterium sgz303538]